MRTARHSGCTPPRSTAARLAAPAFAAGLCLGPLAAAAAASPHDETKAAVQIKDFSFAKVAKVQVGDTVTWVNKGAKPHLAATTKAPVAFSSPKLAAGESWSFKITKPGTYAYVCKLHPDMKATIVAAPTTKAAKGDTVMAAATKPAGSAAPAAEAQEVEIEATAAEVDTEGGRSALIMIGSLAAVLCLGLLARGMPSSREE